MNRVTATLTGPLATRTVLGHAGEVISTDASGAREGEVYTPADVLSAAIASSMASMLSFTAGRKGIDLAGLRVEVEKEMSLTPMRIVSFLINVYPAQGFGPDERSFLEKAAMNCPVKQALHPEIALNVAFHWVQ